MALWSKALPMTAHCLSPLPGFESQHEKVSSDLRFHRVLGFTPLLPAGWSQLSHNWHKLQIQINAIGRQLLIFGSLESFPGLALDMMVASLQEGGNYPVSQILLKVFKRNQVEASGRCFKI